MGSIQSYKDLLIWQKGIEIVVSVYKLTKNFPQEELFSLTSQIERASVSVPSNIAEGYGRNTDKSFSHFWISLEDRCTNLKRSYLLQEN